MIPRRLRWRIALSVLACGGIGLAAATFAIQEGLRSFEPALARDLLYRVDDAALAACERDPSRWALETPNGLRYDAYDPATLASRNPSALPLEQELVARLAAGHPHPASLQKVGPRWGVKMLVRGRGAGPCGLVQIARPADPGMRRALRRSVAASVLLPLGGAVIGVVFLLGPLLTRLRRLRGAAQQVGAAAYVPLIDDRRDELAEVAQALDRAHARIVDDARLLEHRRLATERFLEDVVHDLRVPLAALQISLEEIADGCAGDRELRPVVRSALGDVVYAGSLVANLRLASRLDAGWDPLAGDPVAELSEVVGRVVRRHQIFARRRGIRVACAPLPAGVLVRADATMAEQVVSNLLENAVAYGDEGGEVTVALTVGDGRFALTVADDGPGVPPEALPRLGERTFRSDTARRRDGHGTGLGLAIVTAICERSAWTVTFAAHAPRGLEARIAGGLVAPG